MGIRKQPFGYKISLGETAINQLEAETVGWMFRQYAEGVSYNKLVEALAERGVPYEEYKSWNKNMVARILSDERYIGKGGYPSIVDAEQFYRTAKNRPNCGTLSKENIDVKALRPLLKCAVCEGRLQRRTNYTGWEHWVCPICGVTSDKTSRLAATVLFLLNWLIQDPGQLQVPELDPTTKEIFYLKAELNHALNVGAEEFDETNAKSLIFTLAANRFVALGSWDYETHRLRWVLEHRTPITKLDAALLRETTAAILVGTDGRVSLKLKNGQTIERESPS